MSASFTVFVCSTFDDLEQEREGVLDAIRRVQQRHNAMEFFGARPGRPIDVCLDEVRKSDLLVVIVGLKYGSLPPGMGISYSQAEYEEGARLEKDCLVYLRDDDVPILPKYVERDPEKLRLLDEWKRTLNAKHTIAKFPDWPHLAVQVAADLGHFLLERQFGARLTETAEAKGVPEEPLREVLKRLGETEVSEAEIPNRLAKAADELLRLRADLARLSNDRPESAAIRARATAAISKGDFAAARAALDEGSSRRLFSTVTTLVVGIACVADWGLMISGNQSFTCGLGAPLHWCACRYTDGWPLGMWTTQGVQVAGDPTNPQKFSEGIRFETPQSGTYFSSTPGPNPDKFTVDFSPVERNNFTITLTSENPNYKGVSDTTLSLDGCTMTGMSRNFLAPSKTPFIQAYFQYCWQNDKRCAPLPKGYRPPIPNAERK
jgi:Domain of unknown function (DUF4062)